MDAKSLGRALGLIELIVTTIMAAIKKHGADVFVVVSDDKLRELTNQFIDAWVLVGKAVVNIFRINVGGNRTTKKVVLAGNYRWSNQNINSQLFPWRRRQGKRTIELVADLSDEQLLGPRLPILNPLLWEIGHTAWFQEKWALRHLRGEPPLLERGDALYD